MEMIFTGEPMEATRAADLGMINRVVEDGGALAAALALATLIATNAPMSVRASKRVALESADWDEAEGFARQREHLEPVFSSEDAAEGVAAFKERRDPEWRDR